VIVWKLALRNIFRQRDRTLISLSTIIFGCAALLFVGGFFDNLFIQMRESYIEAHTGHIQLFKKGYHQIGKADPYRFLVNDPLELQELVQQFPEVRSVGPRFDFSGLISTGENTIAFVGQGVEPELEPAISLQEVKSAKGIRSGRMGSMPFMLVGQNLSTGDAKKSILGKGLADVLSVSAGSTVTLLVNTVYGSSNAMDVEVEGVFSTTSKNYDDIFVRIPIGDAQKLIGTDAVQYMVVKLHKTSDTSAVVAKLKNLIQTKGLDLELRTWEELTDYYTKTFSLFNQFYLIMQFVTSVIVVLGVFNTMNMAVMERFSEIGTIMALGTKKKGVLKLFLFEGLTLGCIGGAIGILVGMIVVWGFATAGIVMPPPPGGTFKWISAPSVVPSLVISTFFLSIFIGGISALYPAYRASKLVIVEALRYR